MPALPQTTREYQLTEIGSYKNLVLKETNLEPPKALEVLVKVHAVSLQYRDLSIANGSYDANAHPGLVPCSDMAGEIIALGEGVKNLKVGDRVCANFAPDHIYGDTNKEIQDTSFGGQSQGVLTEYSTFPAHSIVKFPDFLSYEQASTLPCAGVTAYNALHGPTEIKSGDWVLVLGTGGVSIFALQLAVAAGATVIATSSSDKKLEVAKKLGAKHTINYRQTPDWDKEVKKITSGEGVDHVIEVGGEGTLPKSMNSARWGGHIHIVGFVSQDKKGAGNIVQSAILNALILRGIQVGSVAQFKDLIRVLEANPDKTTPIVDKVFPFDQAIEAYAYLESQKHVGKVVIKVA